MAVAERKVAGERCLVELAGLAERPMNQGACFEQRLALSGPSWHDCRLCIHSLCSSIYSELRWIQVFMMNWMKKTLDQ